MPRHDGRAANQLRTLKFTRGYASAAAGSVLVEWGGTIVLCTASVGTDIPPWLVGKGRGWVTAEYNMLPGSTSPRKARKPDGRSTEIQRIIGRSLRAGVDLAALGERTITVDCDVLRADGGTRTASAATSTRSWCGCGRRSRGGAEGGRGLPEEPALPPPPPCYAKAPPGAPPPPSPRAARGRRRGDTLKSEISMCPRLALDWTRGLGSFHDRGSANRP